MAIVYETSSLGKNRSWGRFELLFKVWASDIKVAFINRQVERMNKDEDHWSQDVIHLLGREPALKHRITPRFA